MAETIDVCICTFRRKSLQATLVSLAGQTLEDGVRLRIIVADNDDTPVRCPGIMTLAHRLGLDISYVHAPARNISVARNACLDAARADWLVFIDDDEVAAHGWIAALLRHRTGHDIVFGVSQARYPHPQTPAWVVQGDFHSNRIAGNDAPWNGYTANVLIDRRMIAAAGVRFQPALGQTGGEDTMFFFDAKRAGARFGYAPDAIVTEDTPVERAGWRWLARRRFRSGQVHYLLLRRGGAGRLAGLAAAPKAMACFAQAMLALPSRRRTAAAALRGMLHVGVLASMAGYAPYREYAERSAG